MKKLLTYMMFFVLVCTGIVSCNTDIEALDVVVPDEKSEEYWENLRAYKARDDHEVFFGWFGGWTANSANMINYLQSLPDSMGIVSIWGQWHSLNEAQRADLKLVQEKKGIKVIGSILMFQIGDGITPARPDDFKGTWNEWQHNYWGWIPGDEEAINASVVKYANAICDTIYKYNLDGFDLDAEPSFAQPFETNKELWNRGNARAHLLIETMAKRIGPKAETAEGKNKLLVVDGEPYAFSPEFGQYFNYFILQTYGCWGETKLERGLTSLIEYFSKCLSEEEITNKIIVTETIESGDRATSGGCDFINPEGVKMNSIAGMAAWKPQNGFRKGGCGTYHMENDYRNFPNYKWTRDAIRRMSEH